MDRMVGVCSTGSKPVAAAFIVAAKPKLLKLSLRYLGSQSATAP